MKKNVVKAPYEPIVNVRQRAALAAKASRWLAFGFIGRVLCKGIGSKVRVRGRFVLRARLADPGS